MSGGGRFVGADPPGLEALAGHVAFVAAALESAGRTAYGVLASFGGEADADRTAFVLVTVSRTLANDAVDLQHRADLVARADATAFSPAIPRIVTESAHLEAQFAQIAPFGAADWDLAYQRWRDGPDLDELEAMPPQAVADRLVATSDRALARLVVNQPEFVGSLDGAPPQLRYRANRILIQREITRLEAEVARMETALADLLALGPWGGRGTHLVVAVQLGRIDEARRSIDRYRAWTDDDRQVLLFDPRADGRVAEVFGDLAAAEHVAVVVPGVTNDISNFGPSSGGGFRTTAHQLQEAAAAIDPSTATIAWLGYDTPDGADALLRTAAEEGRRDLVRFVDGLVVADRHVTVIGHSYGSLVTGLAAGDGVAADDVVFVGSPGTGLDHAGDAVLPVGGRVWVGLAAWDPIGLGIDPAGDDLLEWALSIPGRYVWDVIVTGDPAIEDLWHGTNPAHESFGAVEFTTDGATGHSQYFDLGTESLENLARIVAGRWFAVEVVAPDAADLDPFELAPGPRGRFGAVNDPGWGGELA